MPEHALAADDCLEYHDGDNGCRGPVEYHTTGSSMKAWPRCAHHFDLRLDRYENSIERYADSDVIPEWFDPTIAGERWNEDD